jgi:hypothetical protein
MVSASDWFDKSMPLATRGVKTGFDETMLVILRVSVPVFAIEMVVSLN